VDKHTERGRGVDTRPRLLKAAAVLGVSAAVERWSEEEKLKSHGAGVQQEDKEQKQSQLEKFWDEGQRVSNPWGVNPYESKARQW
jgi:hypothetical protein